MSFCNGSTLENKLNLQNVAMCRPAVATKKSAYVHSPNIQVKRRSRAYPSSIDTPNHLPSQLPLSPLLSSDILAIPTMSMPAFLDLDSNDAAQRAHFARFASLDAATQARMLESALAAQATPRVNVNKLPSGHLVLENNCVLTALYNQRMYKQNGRHLRVVVGSLGLGVTTREQQALAHKESDVLLKQCNVWWEWGGPQWKTAADFQRHQAPGRFDGHVWLVQDPTAEEKQQATADADTVPRIFDVLPRSVWRVAKLNARRLVAPEPTEKQAALVLEGKTASECARLGFQYVEAPAAVTHDILQMFEKHYGTVTDSFLDSIADTSVAVKQ